MEKKENTLASIVDWFHRSMVMLLAYVAQDTVRIAEAAQCLSRHMRQPRSGHSKNTRDWDDI